MTQYIGLCHDDPALSLSELGLADTRVAGEDVGGHSAGTHGTAPQRLRGARWLSLCIQALITLFPVLFIGMSSSQDGFTGLSLTVNVTCHSTSSYRSVFE